MTYPARLSRVLAAVVLSVIVAAALVISYQGLYETARVAGVPTPVLFPVLVDAFALMLAVIAGSLRAERRPAWPAHLALVAVTAWSVWCQVSTVRVDGGTPTAFDRVVHAWAPVIAVAAFEYLLWCLHPRGVAEVGEEPAMPVDVVAASAPTVLAVPVPAPATARDESGLDPKIAAAVRLLHAEGARTVDDITGRMLGDRLGLSDSAGRKIRNTNRETIAALLDELEALTRFDSAATLDPLATSGAGGGSTEAPQTSPHAAPLRSTVSVR